MTSSLHARVRSLSWALLLVSAQIVTAQKVPSPVLVELQPPANNAAQIVETLKDLPNVQLKAVGSSVVLILPAPTKAKPADVQQAEFVVKALARNLPGYFEYVSLPNSAANGVAVVRLLRKHPKWMPSCTSPPSTTTFVVEAVPLTNNLVKLSCSDPNPTNNSITAAKAVINALSGTRRVVGENQEIKLFYNRNASKIAEALGSNAKAVADDTLFIATSTAGTENHLEEMKRLIALLDSPLSQVTVNAWTFQISSSKPEDLENTANRIRSQVAKQNDVLSQAIDRGWRWIQQRERQAQREPQAMINDPYLARYLTARYIRDDLNPKSTNYSLGYDSLLSDVQPSLSHMLLAIIVSASPHVEADNWIDVMEQKDIDFMEQKDGKDAAACSAAGGAVAAAADPNCETLDRDLLSCGKMGLECFRRHLHGTLADPSSGHTGALRKAVADFLFQHKMTVQYPHEFVPYDCSASAQRLDAEFTPLVEAFNRDLRAQTAMLLDTLKQAPSGTARKRLQGGLVTVNVLSGVRAQVETKTQNYLEASYPASLQDFVSNMATGTLSGPTPVAGNLSANAAVGALAALKTASVQPTIAKIGNSLTLKMTPHTLNGAYGIGMEVDLESTEDTAGTLSTPTAPSATDDVTSRVSRHHVVSTIRVSNAKLFELSTLSATLQQPRRPLPIIFPILEIPYLGGILKLPRSPATTFHRSFMVASAVVVPTAADLANSIGFTGDRTRSATGDIRVASLDQLGTCYTHITPYHQQRLRCFSGDLTECTNDDMSRITGDIHGTETGMPDMCPGGASSANQITEPVGSEGSPE